MNRRELIRAVAAYTADDAKHVESVLSGVTDVITAVVAKGEPVTVQGFAKFAKVERAARMGRNPRTGEPIRIKASKRVRVTPMKAFKETVMSPSHAPRLASGVYPTSPELLAKQAAQRRAAATNAVTVKRAAGRTAAPARSAAKKTLSKATTATPATTRSGAAKRATTAAKTTAAKTTAAKKTAAAKTAAAKTTAAKTTAAKTAAAKTAARR